MLLFSVSNFVHTESSVDEGYRKYKQKNYYSPADLLHLVREKHGLIPIELHTDCYRIENENANFVA